MAHRLRLSWIPRILQKHYTHRSLIKGDGDFPERQITERQKIHEASLLFLHLGPSFLLYFSDTFLIRERDKKSFPK